MILLIYVEPGNLLVMSCWLCGILDGYGVKKVVGFAVVALAGPNVSDLTEGMSLIQEASSD